MKTGKKIAVALAAALTIAMFAAGAVSMVGAIEVPASFAVVVKGTPDVTVTIGDGGVDFGSLEKGESRTLSDSVVLTNNGDATAKVDARFISHVGEVHGLVNAEETEVLPASNLELGTTGKEVALDNAEADVDLTVDNYLPAGEARSFNAKLTIPAGQSADTYAGVIDITISTA